MPEELKKAMRVWVEERDRVERQRAFDQAHEHHRSNVSLGVSSMTAERLKAAEDDLYMLATRYIF